MQSGRDIQLHFDFLFLFVWWFFYCTLQHCIGFAIHWCWFSKFRSVQSLSCVPMNCSMPGLPVHHQLPESTQTHVHSVGDAIQPSHRLLSPSPPAINLSQHQGLFKRVSSLHQVDKVLEFQLPYQSFQWTPMTHLLYDGLVGSPCSPRDSQKSFPTP